MAAYKNIFFDLDDTLWAFTENARDTFQEMYLKYNFDAYFDSFEHYYSLYQARNLEPFFYPLQAVGVEDRAWSKQFADDFFTVMPTKTKLMPHAKEILEYLAPKYNLYILSNGFRELQAKKMAASGIDGYFKKIILSEDIGVMKPYPQIFYFALSATQSELKESIMIGDSWKADIEGAKGVGMDYIFYNVEGRAEFPFKAMCAVNGLEEVGEVL